MRVPVIIIVFIQTRFKIQQNSAVRIGQILNALEQCFGLDTVL